MRVVRRAFLAAFFVVVGFVAAGDAGPVAHASPPITFNCTWDSNCPEISIAGDPVATLSGSPSPFRGYGDPSLERDPLTGTIWMAYSWLDLLVSNPGPPPVVDLGVSTHLARSDDGGHTFTFVRALNSTDRIVHPDSGANGWAIHEVPTIAPVSGGWEALWLTYFDPLGSPPSGPSDMTDNYYTRSLAASPDSLGDSSQAWARGYVTSPSFGVAHDLSQIPQLSDCAAFTEPSLLAYGGQTYLATNCVAVANGAPQYSQERLVLLREDPGGYTYLGTLLDYADARDNGAQRLEQADLAVAQNGAVLLIVTPIDDAQFNDIGCRVFEVADLATARVSRDPSGKANVLMSIAGDISGDALGAASCTYDSASATGVVLVETRGSTTPFNISFSMHATGLHPQGVDTDGDGLADSVDPCPLLATPWAVQPGDSDCDGFPDSQEALIGTDPARRCAATPAPDDEPPPDVWPVDFDNNQRVLLPDIAAYSSVYGSRAPGPPYSARFDLNLDGMIGLADIATFSSFYGKSCA